ncbi:MAG: hypothetical protein ACK52S_11180 [Pirellula sp.]|jgi:hypothetical protein
MLETIRRYWIGLLVLVLVTLHASIVGIIRYQASMAKTDVSCEVSLGSFLAYRAKGERPVEMDLHAIVPVNHRMKSRQLIELNQAQVRQALEEHLRQIDGRLLIDPYLTDLRSQLLEILTQTLGASSIEDVVVTKMHQSFNSANLEFLSDTSRPEPRKLVATLRSQQENAEGESGDADSHEGDEAHAADGEHGTDGDHAATDSHGTSSAKSHSAPAKSDSKKAAAKGHDTGKSSGHGKPAAKH